MTGRSADLRIPIRGGFVDLATRRVVVDDRDDGLTTNERAVLGLLVAEGGTPVPVERVLREALGFAPGSRSRAAHAAIQRLRRKLERNPAAPAHLQTVRGAGFVFAPLEGPDGGTRVAPPGDRGFGRSETRREAARRLAAGARLLVLTGPGGIGKTRLARELAAESPGAVAWVDLVPVRDGDGVVRQVGQALGVEPDRVAPTLASGRAALVVLDNAEHLRDAVRDAVERWSVGSCVQFLVTSRVPLGGPDGSTLPVEPLDVGDAIALLCDRAGWEAEPAIRRVAERLEGHPLALELAAGRIRTLGPSPVLAALDASLDVLRARGAERPERHRTLTSAIDGTLGLLEAAALSAAERLSAFRGTFGAGAAAAVLECGEAAAEHRLQALTAVGIVRPDAPGWRLWSAVRERLWEAASPEVRHSARRAHARWAASLGGWRAIAAHDRDPAVLAAAAAVQDDLVEAAEWALAQGELEVAARVLLPICLVDASGQTADRSLELALRLRTQAGPEAGAAVVAAYVTACALQIKEHHHRAYDAVARLDLDEAPHSARAHVALLRARAAFLSGYVEQAAADHARAAREAGAMGDPVMLASVWLSVARAGVRTDAEAAVVDCDRAISAARDAGAGAVEGLALGTRAVAHAQLGLGREAVADSRRAIALLESAGRAGSAEITRSNLGEILYRLGENDEAESTLLRVYDRFVERARWRSAAITAQHLALLAGLRHRTSEARWWIRIAHRHALSAEAPAWAWRIRLVETGIELRAGLSPARARAQTAEAISELAALNEPVGMHMLGLWRLDLVLGAVDAAREGLSTASAQVRSDARWALLAGCLARLEGRWESAAAHLSTARAAASAEPIVARRVEPWLTSEEGELAARSRRLPTVAGEQPAPG